MNTETVTPENITPAQVALLAPFARSFPAASMSADWTDRVVKQGHVDYCAVYGHATHTIDGADQGRCPRCGAATAEDVARELPVTVPEGYTPLMAHIIGVAGKCLVCGDEATTETYAEYVAQWYATEYEGEPGHEPMTEEVWLYISNSCLGTSQADRESIEWRGDVVVIDGNAQPIDDAVLSMLEDEVPFTLDLIADPLHLTQFATLVSLERMVARGEAVEVSGGIGKPAWRSVVRNYSVFDAEGNFRNAYQVNTAAEAIEMFAGQGFDVTGFTARVEDDEAIEDNDAEVAASVADHDLALPADDGSTVEYPAVTPAGDKAVADWETELLTEQFPPPAPIAELLDAMPAPFGGAAGCRTAPVVIDPLGREVGDVLVSRMPIGNTPAGYEWTVLAIERAQGGVGYRVRAYGNPADTRGEFVPASSFERN